MLDFAFTFSHITAPMFMNKARTHEQHTHAHHDPFIPVLSFLTKLLPAQPELRLLRQAFDQNVTFTNHFHSYKQHIKEEETKHACNVTNRRH
jgi:hypothetical protein